MKQPADSYREFNVVFIVGLAMLLAVFTVHMAKVTLGYKEIDTKFSEVWTRSESLRKTYSWFARTEVIRDEETVNLLIEKYEYSRDGRLLSMVISEEQAELPSFFLIRQLAEASKNRLITFMNGLKVYLEQYALTDDSLRHRFFAKAAIGIPDEEGLLVVAGSDVITDGDKLTWWIDTNSYSMNKVIISTTFEDSQVEFSASYSYLPTGMNNMSRAGIRVPGKDLVVKLQFYDFEKKD